MLAVFLSNTFFLGKECVVVQSTSNTIRKVAVKTQISSAKKIHHCGLLVNSFFTAGIPGSAVRRLQEGIR